MREKNSLLIKRGCYILLYLFSALFCSAQIRIQGNIKDSAGNAVTNATVSIIDKHTKLLLLYAYTDKGGHYLLISDDIFPWDSIAIKAIAPLFLAQEKNLSPNESLVNFVLAAEPKKLPPVTVTNKPSLVSIKGDTLSFKVNDFARSTDRVIADVIRNIPGIEIMDNGMIRYRGKPLNYFYIDGENMFDKGYRVATDNIPVDFVDRIQVIEKNQHIKALNGIVPSYDPAINITLSDKAKTVWENNVKAAAGDPGIYDDELTNLAFKRKFSLLNTVKANNAGKDPLDQLGGFGNSISIGNAEGNAGIYPLLNTGLASTPPVGKERYLFNNSAAINTNDFFKGKKGMSFRTNSYYVYNRNELDYRYLSSYYMPGDTINYTEQQQQYDNRNDLHITLNMNRNAEKKYFDNTFSFDYASSNLDGKVISNGQPLGIQLNDKGDSFSNKLYGVKVFHNNSFIEYNSQISYQEKPQQLTVVPGLHADILNNGVPFRSAKQESNTPSFLTNNYIKARMGIKDISLQLRAGLQYQYANLLTQLYKEDLLNNVKTVSDSFANHLNWQRLEIYADPLFEWKTNKTRITLHIPLKSMSNHYEDSSFNRQTRSTQLIVNPSLQFDQQVGSESSLYGGFSYNNSFSGVTDAYYGNVMTNYLSFESHDVPVQQRKYRNAQIRYEYRKALKLFFLSSSLNYAETSSDYLYSTLLDDGIIRSRLLFQPNTVYVSGADINSSKYLYFLRLNLAVNYHYSYSRSQHLQNNVLFPSDFTGQILRISLQTHFSPDLGLNYESGYTWGEMKNKDAAGNQTATSNYTSSQRINLTFTLVKRISGIFQNEYYYYHYQHQPTQSLLFSDIIFRYSLLKSKTDFELAVNNIADIKQYSIRNISPTGLSGSDYVLRPRMVLLRVAFRF